MSNPELTQEWSLLQSQVHSYECRSLVIKLVAVSAIVATLVLGRHATLWVAAITAILWLQDAIWKTFQQRIEQRIVRIERAIAEQDKAYVSCQLHREFHAERQRGGMVGQYLSQAVRPTVAFPYVALLAVLAMSLLA